jgi:hypothetical protein
MSTTNAPANASVSAIKEPLMPVFNIHHCFVSSTLSSHATALSQSLMINVPSKIWHPKPANRYVPLDHGDDIEVNLLVFTQHGDSVCRLCPQLLSLLAPTFIFGIAPATLPTFPIYQACLDWRPRQLCRSQTN